MKIGRGSRRSIRYSVFIGILAGSVFSGTGAFATPIEITTQIELEAIGQAAEKPIDGDYFLNFDSQTLTLSSPASSTYILGSFTGTFDGRGKTLDGLVAPLFDQLTSGAQISDLTLITKPYTSAVMSDDGISLLPPADGGLIGQGVLANTADFSTITNVHTEGDLFTSADEAGGLLGASTNSVITTSSSNVTINAYAQTAGGLVGSAQNTTITESFASGDVNAWSSVGGLVGYAVDVTIGNSYASGEVEATGDHVGGLVGEANNSDISNSYSSGNVSAYGGSSWRIGGLVGFDNFGTIDSSFALGQVKGINRIGGLVGEAAYSDYSNLFSQGNVIALEDGWGSFGSFGGGLIGYTYDGNYENLYATGNLTGDIQYAGGLIGYDYQSNFINIAASGILRFVINFDQGGLFGGTNSTDLNLEPVSGSIDSGDVSEIAFSAKSNLEVLNVLGETAKWGQITSCNFGNPHLISLITLYQPSCESPSSPGPTSVGKIGRESLEPREIEKIEKTLGFMKELQLAKNAPIAFVETTEKIDIAKVKAVEIAPTANVKVAAKAGEALQISLKSESKEPVELWVKSPDGTWLLAGVITFDKDGKAILPPLQFKNAGDYTLVLNKPSVDSAKGSAPLNQSGSVLVAVS